MKKKGIIILVVIAIIIFYWYNKRESIKSIYDCGTLWDDLSWEQAEENLINQTSIMKNNPDAMAQVSNDWINDEDFGVCVTVIKRMKDEQRLTSIEHDRVLLCACNPLKN